MRFKDFVRHMKDLGYEQVKQEGSHVKFRNEAGHVVMIGRMGTGHNHVQDFIAQRMIRQAKVSKVASKTATASTPDSVTFLRKAAAIIGPTTALICGQIHSWGLSKPVASEGDIGVALRIMETLVGF